MLSRPQSCNVARIRLYSAFQMTDDGRFSLEAMLEVMPQETQAAYTECIEIGKWLSRKASPFLMRQA